jgi:hypothetical protein
MSGQEARMAPYSSQHGDFSFSFSWVMSGCTSDNDSSSAKSMPHKKGTKTLPYKHGMLKSYE